MYKISFCVCIPFKGFFSQGKKRKYHIIEEREIIRNAFQNFVRRSQIPIVVISVVASSVNALS